MSKTFGKYIDEFEEVIFCEKHNKNDVYSGYNIKEKRPVSQEVINKEQMSDYNLFIKNLEKEVQMVKLCKSDYILDFYRYMETDKNIIKEQSWTKQIYMNTLKIMVHAPKIKIFSNQQQYKLLKL